MIRRILAIVYGLALGWIAFLAALLVFGVLVFATGSARAEPAFAYGRTIWYDAAS